MSIDEFWIIPEQVIVHTLEFFKAWDEDFPHDFVDDNDVEQIREQVHKIFDLLSSIDISERCSPDISSLLQKIDMYFYVDSQIKSKEFLNQEPIYIDIICDETKPIFQRADPFIIAQHFMSIEIQKFSAIERIELLQWSRESCKKDSRSKHLQQLIQHFNRTSLYVGWSILSTKSLQERVRVLESWIRILDAAYQIKNFNLLFEIDGSLNHPAVERLSETWRSVDPTLVSRFSNLTKITSPLSKFKNYFQELNKCDVGTTLPNIGPWLTDMTFIEDGKPNYVTLPNKEKGINFLKQKLYYEPFTMIQKPWGAEMRFELSKVLIDSITKEIDETDRNMDDAEMFNMSHQLEKDTNPDSTTEKFEYKKSDKEKDCVIC
ncbi:RasGEF domain containing protein [Histomonas meleagridis]|uniref:RasGEF domain containing protein n=1 Tax=Histomonas meleagridis TaxID=135588 RepID=UPI003559F653|nr:RasGEF domain containing protein [Histomonas meleagridis]KAH0798521.1 RasGEF domain containing protein [Histomonas meleagridis]